MPNCHTSLIKELAVIPIIVEYRYLASKPLVCDRQTYVFGSNLHSNSEEKDNLHSLEDLILEEDKKKMA